MSSVPSATAAYSSGARVTESLGGNWGVIRTSVPVKSVAGALTVADEGACPSCHSIQFVSSNGHHLQIVAVIKISISDSPISIFLVRFRWRNGRGG